MCLALLARVVELLPIQRAMVDLGGVCKEVSIDLVDDAQFVLSLSLDRGVEKVKRQ